MRDNIAVFVVFGGLIAIGSVGTLAVQGCHKTSEAKPERPRELTAEEDGFECAIQGLPVEVCPHPFDGYCTSGARRREWLRGWRRGFLEVKSKAKEQACDATSATKP